MTERDQRHRGEIDVEEGHPPLEVRPPLIATEADLEAFRAQPEIHVGHVQKVERNALKTRRISQDDQALVPAHVGDHEDYESETVLGLLVRGTLSIGAGVLAFLIVAAIVAAIVVPPWYRNLEPRYQQVWCNRLSILCDLKPDRPEGDVYALGSDVDTSGADALLATNTPTLEPTELTIPTSTPQPTSTPAATEAVVVPTEVPTDIPTATVPPSPTPSSTPIPLPSQANLTLDNLHWEQQTWNNCGPTTITIGLTYFGYEDNQRRAARFLKPNIEDTNVSPNQLVEYVNLQVGGELSVRALYRVGGTPEMLKRLVANDFPVIVERGIIVEGEGWMGHYSLIVGYDDLAEDGGEYLLFDSYLGYSRGEGRRFAQDSIEDGWRQFNYTFVVLYTPSREGLLREILGQHADPTYAAQFALDMARADATADADDKWAWFNIGTSYTLLGQYDEAALAYDRARQMRLEFRMLWYQFGPYIAYLHTGRYEDVLALALQSERTTPYVEEVYYYRGLAYAAQGESDSAVFQFDRTLQYNPNYVPAEEAKQAVLEGRFEVSMVH